MTKRKGDEQDLEAMKKAKQGFEMDYLMGNPGLDHLSKRIFQLLNVQSVARCRLVSKFWCQYLDKIWLVKQLETYQNKIIEMVFIIHEIDEDGHFWKKPLVEYQPEWIQIFKGIVKQNNIDDLKAIVKFVKQYYFDIEASRLGMTPLHYACKCGHLEFFKVITSTGASLDFHSRDNSRSTLLHHACFSANIEIVRILIEKNLDVNAADDDGKTPLHMACEIGATEIVRLLERGNANFNATDEDLMTPLSYAALLGREEVVKLFIESETIDVNFNATDRNGFTLLHHACKIGNTNIVQLVLKHSTKLDIDFNTTDFDSEMTPLHFACKYGQTDIVKVLLDCAEEKGIDLKAWDADGKTPLQVASKETVQVLLDYASQKGMNLMQWIPVWPWN